MNQGKSFIRICAGLNVAPIAESLLANPQLWDEHPHRRIFNGSPHSQMVDIWARFGDISKGGPGILAAPHDSVWYPCAEIISGLKDIAFEIMALVDGERLGGILITKLPPGASIAPHVDSGWHAEYYDKFYVSVQSPKGSAFCFEDGEIISSPGDCYYFQNDRTHWVKNDSDSDRISIIICIKTEAFRCAQ